jgi:hypothetical protein
VPLERTANGQLSAASKDAVVQALQKFAPRKNWQPRVRVLCAISAGGVSLRRLSLPAGARDEIPKLLRLQIEAEFPLPPEELAWGYRALDPSSAAPKQDFLVGAVKKDRVEEYAGLLLAAGLSPVFTPAVLARSFLAPQPLGSCALLDVSATQLELISFENGVPSALRIFPWEKNGAAEARLPMLARALTAATKVYVTGSNGAPAEVSVELRSKFGIACERLEIPAGTGQTAAVLGLKKSADGNLTPAPLFLQTTAKPAAIGNFKFTQPALPKKWAVAAVLLLAALLFLPYAEALVLKGHLAKKIARLKSGQGNLATIDHEYDFLSYLKQNSPPYLDALYLFAKAAPPGARIESTSMNRRGEVSLRGSMRDAQQVTDFRAKLIDSGFFDRVTVEEQAPTPDRQKVNVRITAQWKPVGKRLGLAIGPTRDEIEKAKTNSAAKGGSPMPGGMPPGLPPGIIMR